MDSARISCVKQSLLESNESALTELYKLYHTRLLLFAKSIVRTKELAEEVVEDVFIKLWRNKAGVSQVNNLNVYLYTAVKNTSLNCLSHKAKELVSAPFDFLNIELENEIANPDDLMITAEMMQNMHKAIDNLPPRCKMIFRLVREDGLKYKEVSEILNISVNTIDAQMAIAVKKICAVLKIDKPQKHFSEPLEK